MLRDSIFSKKLKWIYKTSSNSNNIAILIPQFNEFSEGIFIERLSHFKRFAESHRNMLDVIIVDDGSTDNSLEVIERFIKNNPVQFSVVSITPNAHKIGALYLTTLNIDYDYVLYSDFDTDLENLEYMPEVLAILENNPLLMGCYFRMVPMKGSSAIARYQQFEYSLHRKWYEYTSAEGSVAVMPGAGSLFKREIIIKLLEKHSGLFNGEDRETTAMGIEMGYKTIYQKKMRVLTRPPKTIKKLISQRIRWNLGYIETINKEKEYYLKRIKSFTAIGIRTFFDIASIGLLLLFPLIIVLLGLLNLKICLLVVGAIYFSKLFWVFFLSLIGKNEIEVDETDYMILLLYPILKVLIEVPSWSIATYKFLVTDYSQIYQTKPVSKNTRKNEVPIYHSPSQNFKEIDIQLKGRKKNVLSTQTENYPEKSSG